MRLSYEQLHHDGHSEGGHDDRQACRYEPMLFKFECAINLCDLRMNVIGEDPQSENQPRCGQIIHGKAVSSSLFGRVFLEQEPRRGITDLSTKSAHRSTATSSNFLQQLV